MRRARRLQPYRTVTSLKAALAATLTAVLGGILLLWGSSEHLWQHRAGLQTLVNSLGGSLIASVALAILWELVGKRAFSRELLETARTTTDVETAGLVRVGTRYLDDPDWERYFASVAKLDIFVAYGRTWRNNNLERLRRVAADRNARIRVYLPDASDQLTRDVLASRFNMPVDDLVAAVSEARTAYAGLRRPDGAQIRIFERKGDHVFSCYRFDTVAIITLYTHSRERRGVPTLVCSVGGALYDFVREELDAIETQSTPVHPR